MIGPTSEMRKAEAAVRQWLDSSDARYLSQRDDRHLPLDFVVYSPICIGIELRNVALSNNARLKAKRGLSARTALVDEFGPELPLVVIAVGSNVDVDPARLLADAAFPINGLPTFAELRSVRIGPEVRDILRRGAPRDVKITDPELLVQTWSRSLSLSELVDRQDLPPGGLAHRIHEAAHTILQDRGAVDTTRPIRRPLMSRIGPGSLVSLAEPPSALDALLLRPSLSDTVERLISQHAVETVGGSVETAWINLPSGGKNLLGVRLPIWRLRNGRQIVLRKLTVSDATADHRVKELIAEAWLLRAADALVNPSLYLLLTELRQKQSLETISGPQRALMSMDLVRSINHFESAGWEVFPWDFAEPEPAYIKSARLMSEGLP